MVYYSLAGGQRDEALNLVYLQMLPNHYFKNCEEFAVSKFFVVGPDTTLYPLLPLFKTPQKFSPHNPDISSTGRMAPTQRQKHRQHIHT